MVAGAATAQAARKMWRCQYPQKPTLGRAASASPPTRPHLRPVVITAAALAECALLRVASQVDASTTATKTHPDQRLMKSADKSRLNVEQRV